MINKPACHSLEFEGKVQVSGALSNPAVHLGLCLRGRDPGPVADLPASAVVAFEVQKLWSQFGVALHAVKVGIVGYSEKGNFCLVTLW